MEKGFIKPPEMVSLGTAIRMLGYGPRTNMTAEYVAKRFNLYPDAVVDGKVQYYRHNVEKKVGLKAKLLSEARAKAAKGREGTFAHFTINDHRNIQAIRQMLEVLLAQLNVKVEVAAEPGPTTNSQGEGNNGQEQFL